MGYNKRFFERELKVNIALTVLALFKMVTYPIHLVGKLYKRITSEKT